MDLKQMIEKATSLAWAQFEAEHPNLAASLERTFGDQLQAKVIQSLQNDERYQSLVEQTDAETNVAAIISSLLPIVTDVAMKLLL